MSRLVHIFMAFWVLGAWANPSPSQVANATEGSEENTDPGLRTCAISIRSHVPWTVSFLFDIDIARSGEGPQFRKFGELLQAKSHIFSPNQVENYWMQNNVSGRDIALGHVIHFKNKLIGGTAFKSEKGVYTIYHHYIDVTKIPDIPTRDPLLRNAIEEELLLRELIYARGQLVERGEKDYTIRWYAPVPMTPECYEGRQAATLETLGFRKMSMARGNAFSNAAYTLYEKRGRFASEPSVAVHDQFMNPVVPGTRVTIGSPNIQFETRSGFLVPDKIEDWLRSNQNVRFPPPFAQSAIQSVVQYSAGKPILVTALFDGQHCAGVAFGHSENKDFELSLLLVNIENYKTHFAPIRQELMRELMRALHASGIRTITLREGDWSTQFFLRQKAGKVNSIELPWAIHTRPLRVPLFGETHGVTYLLQQNPAKGP